MTQILEARVIPEQAIKPKVRLCNDDLRHRIEVRIGRSFFTAYNYGSEWVRPFLYPVIGPLGTQITRNWPMVDGIEGEHKDHPHHKSIWVAYGECNKVDNWSEEAGHGWQRHRKLSEVVSGPVFGRITAINDWCTPKGRKQFEETRQLTFYALPGNRRLFDLQVTFRMTEGRIVFTDTKEGGLVSVRVASSMDVRNGGKIENGYGGINEGEAWGKSAPWCDYSGPVDGKYVGLAILDHESNPRYPTGWHVRDYGLMTANCFAWRYYRPEAKLRGDMIFGKGSATTWRYRLYLHPGDAQRGRVAARFVDFVAPPKVEVQS
ncbi:MAG: PmoA family protein [Candidatus Hydrogenedentes bacterium]|nr:PmoA family protein [Candidatus Hydrogenedentota bacterium]